MSTNVTLHFAPKYSSWLNQVEIWFSKPQRDVSDRGIFTSVPELKAKIMRYLRLYRKTAKPFRWAYTKRRTGVCPARGILRTAHEEKV